MDASGTNDLRPTETAWLGAILLPVYVGVVIGLMIVMQGSWPDWAMVAFNLFVLLGGLFAAVCGVWLGVSAQRSAVGRGWPTRVKVLAVNAIGLAGFLAVAAFVLLVLLYAT